MLPAKWNTIDGKQPYKPVKELDYFGDVIYTDVVISVDEYIKNPLSSKEVIVRTIGGEIRNISMTTDANPVFKADEKVLLYLRKITASVLRILVLSTT